MTWSAEQISIFRQVIATASMGFSAASGIEPERADALIERMIEFVRTHWGGLSKSPYVLSVSESSSGPKTVTRADVIEALRRDHSIIVVDTQLRRVRSEAGQVRTADCCSRTRAATKVGNKLELLVEGSYVRFVLQGAIVEEMDVNRPGNPSSWGPSWKRRFEDLDKLLEEHYQERLVQEKVVRYWADRKKRILLTGPDGTEMIFHRSLFSWLREYISDAFDVYAEPSGLGQDKTDIKIITIRGDYVIEIKWLGKNESGEKGKKDQRTIDQGLRQVHLYLEREAKLAGGYLVMFDGRPEDEHKNASGWSSKLKHPRCDAPKIQFLESESPSETARAVKSDTAASPAGPTSRPKSGKRPSGAAKRPSGAVKRTRPKIDA